MSKRLLIADDAMIIRELIKAVAIPAGWEVVGEASDGAMAVDLYEKLHPDAVTLDLVMPAHDGIEGLRGIMALNPEAKVVIVSALDQKHVLKEAFKLGASDFVVKPFDRQMLMQTLEQLVAAA